MAILVAILAYASVLAGPPQDDGINWVEIGDPGNPPYVGMDPFDLVYGRGGVDYPYRISRLEVTTAQWMEFVNSYSTRADEWATFAMPSHWGADWDLTWDGPGILWKLKDEPGAGLRPMAGVSWRECAMFCNWLHNGKGTSLWAIADGAYETSTFEHVKDGPGFTDQDAHHPDAMYWIPTLDEWLKAAHWDTDKLGPGKGGWWDYVHMSDEGPPVAGLPGEGETNAELELPDNAHWDIPLGSYPETRTPWGLLDASGGAGEYVEDWLRIQPQQYRMWDGQFAGDGFGPGFEHWLEPIWSPGAQPPTGSYQIGLRVASRFEPCAPDCNADGVLNMLDFVCFQRLFAAADRSADVNGDRVLNILDFMAFQSQYMAGCPRS
jgi:formylglycine-generating enzyme required for sulfatase activity